MISVIAQGTIGGHHCFPKYPSDIEEINLDIRTEISSGSQGGFYIQTTPSGVWISYGKGMDDGERSGGGAGFISFSLYLPSNTFLSGEEIKNALLKLMSYYLQTYTDRIYTRSIGVDWSFVEQEAIRLNSLAVSRVKSIPTHYVPSKKFAYVQIENEEQLVHYLEKPFQPEYGEYLAVFLGTLLLNSDSLSIHTRLNIDLDNEVYDIKWIGDTSKFPNIPLVIRKNQIETTIVPFSLKHYVSDEVRLSSGIRDDLNGTIALQVPVLIAQVYSVHLFFNNSEAVQSIKAVSEDRKKVISSADGCSLQFTGEEVEMSWILSVEAKNDYRSKEIPNFVPYGKNEFHIELEKIKHVYVQILRESGDIATKENCAKFQFLDTKSNLVNNYNKTSNQLEFLIPEKENFDSLYRISLRSPYDNEFEFTLRHLGDAGHTWAIQLRRKAVRNIEHPSTNILKNRKVSIYCPKAICEKQITYEYPGCSSELLSNRKETSEEDYIRYVIEIPESVRRTDIILKDSEQEELSFKCEGNDAIRILNGTSIVKFINWFKKYSTGILLSIVIGILFILACIFVAHFFGYVDVHEWFGQNDSISSVEVTGDIEQIPTLEPSTAYLELSQVLEDQKDTWNKEIIYNVVEKYAGADGQEALDLKNTDSLAYVRLKQLSWLWRTRDIVNRQKWNNLPDLVKANNSTYMTKWISYIDEEKIDLLREFLMASNVDARKNFENKINADHTFPKKSYSEIVVIWDICKKEAKTKKENMSKESAKDTVKVEQTYVDPTLY